MRLIGARVRSVRGALTQEAFGKAIGVSGEAVANYEAGRRLPNSQALEKIAKLGITSTDWLLTGQVPKHKSSEIAAATHLRNAVHAVESLSKLTGAQMLPRVSITADELAVIELIRFARLGHRGELLHTIKRLLDDVGPPFEKGWAKETRRLRRMIERGDISVGLNYEEVRYLVDRLAKMQVTGTITRRGE